MVLVTLLAVVVLGVSLLAMLMVVGSGATHDTSRHTGWEDRE